MSDARAVLVLACLAFLTAFRWDSAPRKVAEGNRLFEKEKYTEALTRYHEAQVARPEAPEIPFNMGNSFYRQEKYDDAIRAHREAARLGGDPFSARSYYNIGNALYRKGELEGALEAYKKAIDLNPDDIDTKVNIEFLQKKMQEMPQQSPSQSPEKEEKEEKEQDAGDEEGKKERDREGNREEESKKTGRPQPQRAEISEEDAERLLNALQGEERPLPASPEEKSRPGEDPPVGKDW